MIRRSELKTWELVLLVLAALLFVGSSVLYLTGVSVRSLALGLGGVPEWAPVGTLAAAQGNVRRQLHRSGEFLSLDRDAQVFNLDTLVTGPDSTATVRLDAGGAIELGPLTMIRLSFDSEVSLQGVRRATRVDVVQGSVTGLPAAADTAPPIVLRSRGRAVTVSRQRKETLRVDSVPIVKPSPAGNAALPPPVPIPIPASPEPSPDPAPSDEPSPLPEPSPSPLASPSPLPEPSAAPSPEPSPSPGPPPVPVTARIYAPRTGSTFAPETGSQNPSVASTLEWRVKPAGTPIRVVLRRLGRPGTQPAEIYRKNERAPAGIGRTFATVRLPGQYEWEVAREDGSRIGTYGARTRFEVSPEFEGLRTLPPLVSGAMADSNTFTGKHLNQFDITLHWAPYPQARSYVVKIYGSPDARTPLRTRATDEDQLHFNKDRVFNGKVWYSVTAVRDDGWVPMSARELFNFAFAPPQPVVPLDGARLSLRALSQQGKTLLLTWQKTNFTEQYEVALARDPEFKNASAQLVKENFFVVKDPKPGSYWWRIRSLSKGATSPFSQARTFVVDP